MGKKTRGAEEEDESGPVQGKSSPARDVWRPSNRPINAAEPSLAYNLRGRRFRFTRPIVTIGIITHYDSAEKPSWMIRLENLGGSPWRTFTFLRAGVWKRMERGGRREGRNRKAGRRYLRVVCRNAIRSDFDTFRYPIPANISAIEYRTSFVLQPTSPLIKRISPIGRTPRQRVARENPESWNEPFDTRSILDAIRPSFDELRQASFVLEGKKIGGSILFLFFTDII